ncbi:MAG: XrtA system polysaccharide chain length determinant [Noviherbaspirillum sp.]
MEELISQAVFFLKGIWKYRWQAAVLSWIVAVAGWAGVYLLPDSYQASARVYVDTQSILKPLMAGMTNIPNVEQQVSIMSRTLISRPNVEKVMRMVDLDLKAKTPRDKETVLSELMKDIKISGTGRDDIYTITYSNPDPRVAKNVVQSLLTIFVESSLGDKKSDSDKAIQFIEDQIQSYEEKLVAAENALKDFKLKNAGLLPREGSNYASQMMAAGDLLNQARLELREAEQARNAIRLQVAQASGQRVEGAPALPVNPELDERIQSLKKNLDNLRLNYTEAHPDIVAAKRLITQLEAQKKEEAGRIRQNPEAAAAFNPMLQQLNVALTEAEARVASMRARADEYAARHARLSAMMKAAPEVESALTQLNRDYEVNKENYEKLLSRREAARLSGDLSATSDMIKFRVVDPPTVPLKPTGPARPQLFSLAFAGALLAGIGGALLVSQLRPTFMTQASLREATGVPVLGTVSMNWTSQEKSRRRRGMAMLTLVMLALAALYAAGMARMLLAP